MTVKEWIKWILNLFVTTRSNEVEVADGKI